MADETLNPTTTGTRTPEELQTKINELNQAVSALRAENKRAVAEAQRQFQELDTLFTQTLVNPAEYERVQGLLREQQPTLFQHAPAPRTPIGRPAADADDPEAAMVDAAFEQEMQTWKSDLGATRNQLQQVTQVLNTVLQNQNAMQYDQGVKLFDTWFEKQFGDVQWPHPRVRKQVYDELQSNISRDARKERTLDQHAEDYLKETKPWRKSVQDTTRQQLDRGRKATGTPAPGATDATQTGEPPPPPKTIEELDAAWEAKGEKVAAMIEDGSLLGTGAQTGE